MIKHCDSKKRSKAKFDLNYVNQLIVKVRLHNTSIKMTQVHIFIFIVHVRDVVVYTKIATD